ncbi:hypothetical protein WR25_21586 [Diploscapter pachys]|uniref:Uncharacterized protein n=1 Tax=Diploscapter pachys TaxID=2018661 RepID=A0A2A2JNX5_9BILA|nr:hypothetical protein WR25_21586 [Diploscapter pachys]
MAKELYSHGKDAFNHSKKHHNAHESEGEHHDAHEQSQSHLIHQGKAVAKELYSHGKDAFNHSKKHHNAHESEGEVFIMTPMNNLNRTLFTREKYVFLKTLLFEDMK